MTMRRIGYRAAKLSDRLRAQHPELPVVAMEELAAVLEESLLDIPVYRLWTAMTEIMPFFVEDLCRVREELKAWVDPLPPGLCERCGGEHREHLGWRGQATRRDAVLTHCRADIKRLAAAHQAETISITGSVARNDDHDDSDYDFLVRFGDKAGLLELAGLRADLEDLLGEKVDVASAGSRSLPQAMIDDAIEL